MFACSDDGDSDSNEPCPSQPELETSAVTIINFSVANDSYEATLNGNINNIPLGVNCEVISVTSQGFVYDTSVQPTIADNVLEVNGQQVNGVATGLSSDATYYVRTYLTNPLGTFYGNEISFQTNITPDFEAPVITLNGDNPQTLFIYQDYNEYGATATDDIDGDITDLISIESNVNNEVEGSYEVVYTVSDSYGNVASETRTVNVDANPVYLDDNGVTVKAREWATGGMTGIIDGVEYTIVGSKVDLLSYMPGVDNTQLSYLCTSLITDMSYLFDTVGQVTGGGNTGDTNVPSLASWDVSNVTNMEGMFSAEENIIPVSYTHELGYWDVSNVTNMKLMFYGKANRQQLNSSGIENWNVSNVTDMSLMFKQSIVISVNSGFNLDIGNWNVGVVTNMDSMFRGAVKFNQDLSSWNVSNVTNMFEMFRQASDFNQDISNWDVSNVVNCLYFAGYTGDVGDPMSWTLPQPDFTNCNPD